MTRILVTGGSGLIGRRAVDALVACGHQVHVLARSVPPAARTDVTWHTEDLLASQDVISEMAAEVLIHLAWNVEHGAFWTSPDNTSWRDVSLTMLRRFAAAGGRRAVVAGTCAEYDWTTVDGVMREASTPLRPATPYGLAKHQLRAAAETIDGLELAWGRVFFLYAPDEDPRRLFASVARALLTGTPAETTAGTQVRDFLHVDDVAGALVAVALSDMTGAVNVGSGTGIPVAELVRQIGDAAGRPELLRIGALPSRAGEPPAIVADTARLRDEVGFRPRFTLCEGVRSAVRVLATALRGST